MKLQIDILKLLNKIQENNNPITLGLLLEELIENDAIVKRIFNKKNNFIDINQITKKIKKIEEEKENKNEIINFLGYSITKELYNVFIIIRDQIYFGNLDLYISGISIFTAILMQENDYKYVFEDYNINLDDIKIILEEYFIELLFKDEQKSNIMNMNINNSDDEDEKISNYKIKNMKEVTSNNNVLDKFCIDLTDKARKGLLDPIIGREKEINRLIQVLSRRKKRNAILVGFPGVGKTAIVEGLAQRIVNGNIPRVLHNKKIYILDLTVLIAGTKFRGQFEERMTAILDELTSNPNIILFIDEIHTIVGAGNSDGSMDVANILKPALSRGEIQIIGATTFDEYREKIEKDGALTRRFQEIIIEPSSVDDAIKILENIKERYEEHHRVRYSSEIITEIVKLSERYINERVLPDKAIDLMDEIGASFNLNGDLPQHLKTLEIELNDLKEEKIRVIKEQRYEEAADLRDKAIQIEKKLEAEKKKYYDSINKNYINVTIEDVLQTVSSISGIPLSKLNSDESLKLLNMEKELTGVIIGQDDAITKIAKSIKRNRIGLKDKNKPLGTFLLLGSTGVGKTLTAKVLAEYLFGDKDSMVRIDMSEYMEKHTVSKLIGAPPGYVGYGKGGQLTEKIRKKPYSVVLFDEIEKAHPEIFNVLLQLLDEGHLTDSLGRKVSFKNCLILMTSNVGVKDAVQQPKPIGYANTNVVVRNFENIIEKSLKESFNPEFLNRLDDIIIYKQLNRDDVNKIIKLELSDLNKRLNEIGYNIKYTDNIIDFMAKVGYSEKYGARPIKRAIQTYIEDAICEAILKNEISEGDDILLDVDGETVIVTKLNTVKCYV